MFLEVNHMSLMVDVTSDQPQLPGRLAVQDLASRGARGDDPPLPASSAYRAGPGRLTLSAGNGNTG
jgi:hypothetical protein